MPLEGKRLGLKLCHHHLGKKDQPKQTKNPLAGRTDARVTDIKAPEIPNKRVKGSKAIRFPLAGRIDARENAKTTEIYVQPMRRLEFHTDNPINFPMDYSLGNTAPVTSRCDHVMEKKLQYDTIKTHRMYSRMSFALLFVCHY